MSFMHAASVCAKRSANVLPAIGNRALLVSVVGSAACELDRMGDDVKLEALAAVVGAHPSSLSRPETAN